LIDHIFDRKERLAKKGMQTKLFTAEEKIEGLQTKNLRQRVEET
jgi:hypothetical protein